MWDAGCRLIKNLGPQALITTTLTKCVARACVSLHCVLLWHATVQFQIKTTCCNCRHGAMWESSGAFTSSAVRPSTTRSCSWDCQHAQCAHVLGPCSPARDLLMRLRAVTRLPFEA